MHGSVHRGFFLYPAEDWNVVLVWYNLLVEVLEALITLNLLQYTQKRLTIFHIFAIIQIAGMRDTRQTLRE